MEAIVTKCILFSNCNLQVQDAIDVIISLFISITIPTVKNVGEWLDVTQFEANETHEEIVSLFSDVLSGRNFMLRFSDEDSEDFPCTPLLNPKETIEVETFCSIHKIKAVRIPDLSVCRDCEAPWVYQENGMCLYCGTGTLEHRFKKCAFWIEGMLK
jgi:hypothetical protein